VLKGVALQYLCLRSQRLHRREFALQLQRNQWLLSQGDGSTVGLKDIGKVKPTPKAVKPKPLPMTPNKEYFKRQKDYVDSMKKKK